MKIIISTVLISLVVFCAKAQDYEDFYTIKERMDTHFDSIIEIYGIENMQGTEYNPYKRWVSYWEPKVYPHGDFNIYKQGYLNCINNFIDNGVEGNNDQLEWDLIGPDRMPDGNLNHAKGLGQIHYIAFDPNDNTNKIMFACSPVGGLWRTTNGGETWLNAGTDKGLPKCGVSSIAIDENDSENIWFVSTGDGESMPGHPWWQKSIGVWRTMNGGQSWEYIGLQNADRMRKLIKVPGSSTHLIVVTDIGVFECTNAMATTPDWEKIIDGNFYDIELHPDPSTNLAFVSGTQSGTVWKIDYVNSLYTELSNLGFLPYPDPNIDIRRITIEISPASDNYLFIAVSYFKTSHSYLFRYNLINNTFIEKGELPSSYDNGCGINPERGLGWTVSPELYNGNLVMVYGNTAPLRMATNLLDDNLCNWSNVTSPYFSCEIHVDQHYMTFQDFPTLWVGNDGGVYRANMPDIQNTWEEKNNGLAVATCYYLGNSNLDPNVFVSGQHDCGSNFYYKDDGTWNEKNVLGGDGYQGIITDSEPIAFYVSYQNGKIRKSTDYFNNYTYCNSPAYFETFYENEPGNPDIIYSTSSTGLWKSVNCGTDIIWSHFDDVIEQNTWTISICESNPDYIYTSWIGQGEYQRVYKSTTGGGTNSGNWSFIGSPIDNYWISSIAIDNNNPNQIWVATSWEIYSVNTISNEWTSYNSGIPAWNGINKIVYLNDSDNELYAATDLGLYYINNSMTEWENISGNLPNTEVRDIEINYTKRSISVATFGRGIWEASICGFNPNPIVIDDDETWDNSRWIFQNIIIESGKTLTISDIVALSEDSRIIIEPGGKLILDEGTLTSACDGMWKGIEVWGDANQHQYTIDGYCAQGQLILKNGAVIENANFGVVLGASGPNMWDPTKAGGIIQVIGNNSMTDPSTSFINNAFAVTFLEYENFHPVYTSVARPNISYLNNAIFEVNDNYHFFGQDKWDKTHVVLYGVSGVDFRGCTFTNESSFTNKGTGINCAPGPAKWLSCGFRVSSICTSQINPCAEESLDKCQFNNLEYGIKTSNTGINTITVEDAVFDNNSCGIHMANTNNASVLFSEFYLGPPLPSEIEECGKLASSYGIYMENCTGFAIEENFFTKAQGVPTGNSVGIRIGETQATDEIYKNYFEGLKYGNYTEGKNWYLNNNWQGLEFLCNVNTGNFADFCVVKGDYEVAGINLFQGDYIYPSGNVFSPTGANFHFYNGGDHQIDYYYCHATTSCPNQDPILKYYIDKKIAVSINECPSHYGGIGENPKGLVLSPEQIIQTEQDYYSALTDYNNTKDLYDNLKDGGNTEALITDVETAWPTDMWELRAKLLGGSPHLSMEVLKTAADKTDVLPDDVIFEILAANPDELKKEELLKYLEDKENPLPQYMIDILSQLATGTTYKTVLQQQMSTYGHNKTRAAHDMIRSIVNDTISNLQDLRNWLDNLGGIRADHQIIDTYLAEENSSDALALANMLPTLYKLEGNELEEHDFYMDMLNLQINLNVQGRNLFELDSTEVSNLVYIAESSKGVGGTQARGILELTHGYAYCSCLNETDTSGYKTSGIINPDILAKVYGFDINVEPNPASEWVAFNYTLPGMEAEAIIKISDVSGKQVATLSIEGKQGQKVWDTRKIKPGIYFYTLNVAGQHKSGKIVISK